MKTTRALFPRNNGDHTENGSTDPAPSSTPTDDVQAAAVAVMGKLCRQQGGLRLEIRVNNTVATLSVATAEPAAQAPAPAAVPLSTPSGNGLKRVHVKILAKATAMPVPAKQLARLAGYPCNSYYREAITFLCRGGYLERTPDGIRLPTRQPAG